MKTSTEQEICGNQLIFAAGRIPKLDALKCQDIGVHCEAGCIAVNQHYQTNIPSLFALGDCTNTPNLTPVAVAEGRAFSDTQFGNLTQAVNYNHIPTAVFSQPELASVGLSEEEARARHGNANISVHRSNFRGLYHLMSGDRTRTTMKLVVHKDTDRILGAHMAGEHAAEIIQSIAIALNCNATKADFDATMALHPSSAEEFVTMA